jgi:hypothetical protein
MSIPSLFSNMQMYVLQLEDGIYIYVYSGKRLLLAPLFYDN